MAKIEKLSISLPQEMVEMLRSRVESGQYGSTSEVIREALRVWRAHEDRQATEIETLRLLWQEGIDSGAGRFTDIEEIKAAARARKTSH